MARVSQEEMDERIAQYGGTALVHAPSVRKVKIRNPQYGLGDDQDPLVPKELDVEVQRWKGPGTNGAEIEAYKLPDGSWEIVKEQPAAVTATAASTKPAIPPGGSSVTEGTPLPDGTWDNNRPRQVIKDRNGTVVWSEELTGADLTAWRAQQQANQPQSGEVRKPVDGRPGWVSITRTTKQGGNETTVTTFIGPTTNGQEVATLPSETASTRVPVKGHPGIYLVTRKDGTTTASHYENEAGAKVPEPPDAPTYNVRHETKNGQTYTIITTTPKDGSKPTITNYGPDGKEVAALPTDEKYAGLAPDTPRYKPDLTKPGAGLFEYRDALDQYMAANPTKLSWQRRQELIAGAQAEAKTVADEFNLGAAVLREQYQSNVTQRGQEMTQANNRAALANTHHQNAIALIEKFAPYLGVEPGNAGKLFLGMMASQLATATAYGGMQTFGREEMDPRLAAFADRTVGAASRAPGSPSTAASPTPPGTPPNALGLGAIGAVPAPGAPANPDVAMAEAIRTASAPPVRDDWRTNPGLTPGSRGPQLGEWFSPGAPPAVQGQSSPLGDTGALPVSMAPMAPALADIGASAFPGDGMPTLRQQAEGRQDYLTMPAGDPSGLGNVLGLGSLGSPFGGGIDYGSPMGPAPLALQSSIPGLTPEIDEIAKRELMMGV